MKKRSDNVIMFPNRGNPPPILSKEKVAIDIIMVKMNHINEALETIIPMLFNNITIAGFDIIPDNDEDEDENIKDNALIVESIRSILCKYYEMKHPLQEVADEFFINKSEGVLSITEHLDLDLSDYDKE
jgi:hypothetical protein